MHTSSHLWPREDLVPQDCATFLLSSKTTFVVTINSSFEAYLKHHVNDGRSQAKMKTAVAALNNDT